MYRLSIRARLVILFLAKGDKARIAVRDFGIGIPPKDLEAIFTPYYRSRGRLINDPGGMGLGLHICKEIIGAHQGKIWAESHGQGSEFIIELPLIEPN